MKRFAIISISFFFVFVVGVVKAQKAENESKKVFRIEKKQERKELRKIEGSITTEYVKKAFYAEWGNIPNVNFKRNNFMDEATFIKNGKEITAYYDADAKLVGTTTILPFEEVPYLGQKEIKKRYPDYEVGNVIFFNDNEANDTDMILFGVQFEDADNYFVELSKGDKKIMLQVNTQGDVFFFKKL